MCFSDALYSFEFSWDSFHFHSVYQSFVCANLHLDRCLDQGLERERSLTENARNLNALAVSIHLSLWSLNALSARQSGPSSRKDPQWTHTQLKRTKAELPLKQPLDMETHALSLSLLCFLFLACTAERGDSIHLNVVISQMIGFSVECQENVLWANDILVRVKWRVRGFCAAFVRLLGRERKQNIEVRQRGEFERRALSSFAKNVGLSQALVWIMHVCKQNCKSCTVDLENDEAPK